MKLHCNVSLNSTESISKRIKRDEDEVNLLIKCWFCKSYNSVILNPGQDIWNKVKKLSKIEQDWETLIYVLEHFLTATGKVLFLERNGTTCLLFLEVWVFPNIS